MSLKLFSDLSILKVLFINAIAFAVSIVTVRELLGVFALIMSISYTVWKWNRDLKKDKN